MSSSVSAIPAAPAPPLPRVCLPVGRLLLAAGLTVTGAALLMAGLAVKEAPISIAGGVLLLPGKYMLWVFIQLCRGNPRNRADEYFRDTLDEFGDGT